MTTTGLLNDGLQNKLLYSKINTTKTKSPLRKAQRFIYVFGLFDENVFMFVKCILGGSILYTVVSQFITSL